MLVNMSPCAISLSAVHEASRILDLEGDVCETLSMMERN